MDTRDAAINAALVLAAVAATFLLLEGVFRLYLGDTLDYRYENGTWLLEPDQTGITAPATRRTATVNRYGVRGDGMPSNSTVIFLGDSLTFGYCLRDNQTLTHRLEIRLRQRFGCDMELVNAGVPGYGVRRMIQLYNRRFAESSADYVVLNVIRGDVWRGKRGSDPYYQRKKIVRKFIRRSSFLAYMKPRLDMLRPLITGGKNRSQQRFDRYLAQDRQRIAAFDQRLQRQNTTLILHVWIDGKDELGFYDRMKSVAEKHDIPMIHNYHDRVFRQYSGEREDLYCPDGHPSGLQTRRVADAIAGEFHNLTAAACQPAR